MYYFAGKFCPNFKTPIFKDHKLLPINQTSRLVNASGIICKFSSATLKMNNGTFGYDEILLIAGFFRPKWMKGDGGETKNYRYLMAFPIVTGTFYTPIIVLKPTFYEIL